MSLTSCRAQVNISLSFSITTCFYRSCILLSWYFAQKFMGSNFIFQMYGQQHNQLRVLSYLYLINVYFIYTFYTWCICTSLFVGIDAIEK